MWAPVEKKFETTVSNILLKYIEKQEMVGLPG